jgi:hypothetical protein
MNPLQACNQPITQKEGLAHLLDQKFSKLPKISPAVTSAALLAKIRGIAHDGYSITVGGFIPLDHTAK